MAHEKYKLHPDSRNSSELVDETIWLRPFELFFVCPTR